VTRHDEGPSEGRLLAVFEASPIGLLVADRAGAIVQVNREIERVFGYTRDELTGRPVEELVPERFRGSHVGLREAFGAAPRVRAMAAGRELYGLRKDGTEVPLEIGLTPVATGEGFHVLASIVDIGERKRTEGEWRVREEERRQTETLEALGTLAGGIAHDFNNVLFGIVGYAELVAKAPTREQAAADLEELLRAAARGRDLVDRILAFSRDGPERRRPLELGPMVAEVARLLRVTLPPSIEVRVHLDAAAPRILADATSIHRVLLNLATNAAHAMPAGGVLELGVESQYLRDSTARARPGLREGPYGVLVVRDTGTGMAPELLGRVFEPFFTTKPEGRGTGLGLATARAIVRRHEGAIELESAVGEGTTARCLFPAMRDEDTAEPDAARGNGERVLLVEDEPSLIEMNARRLTSLGYQVRAERDPLRALALVRGRPDDFDLLVSDHLMPRLLGLDLARAVHDRRPDLPIVLLSSFSESFTEEVLRASGVRHVIRKPVSLGELATALRHTLASGAEDA
jgi:PAS domain S-box-containing protein